MSELFLQSWILWGLPLLALPVIIHLINQYRHRTVQWAAMQFLLSAKRMNRGMARIKQIIILSLRVLILMGLIFALSRPLASGWFGVALGGKADTNIILLDRSVSMEYKDLRTGLTKRETALQKISDLLQKTSSGTRIVLMESAGTEPQELTSAADLLDLPVTGPTATEADVPGMLQRALDYVKDNTLGRTDIWVLTDLRTNDWDPGSGRWEGIRLRAQEMEALRLYILAYPDLADENFAISTGAVSRQVGVEQDSLVMDIRIQRNAASSEVRKLPLGITINGTRTVIDVDVAEDEVVLQGHTIPIDKQTVQGWGRIDLPNDANLQDNSAYFVFGEAPVRRSLVVTDDRLVAAPMLAALGAAPDSGFDYETSTISPDDVDETDWKDVALLLWHAPIPEGVIKNQLEAFVASGRTVIFFPPAEPTENEIFGARWGDWQTQPEPNAAEVGWWRPDSDLLQNSLSGKALPVGGLRLARFATVSGKTNQLARVGDNLPVIARAITDRGGAYFCGVLPRSSHSNLAREGVVFYVMLQRAMNDGVRGLSKAQMAEAGTMDLTGQEWKRLAPNDSVLLSQQMLRAGAFQNGDQFLALNRPQEEDRLLTIAEAEVEPLLGEVNYEFLQDQAGGSDALANEIWRAFLVIMGLALLAEAILCLPQTRNTVSSGSERATP